MHSSGTEVFSQSLLSVAAILSGIELVPSCGLAVEVEPQRCLGC